MRADPTERMKAKLQERVRATVDLRPGETFDFETGEIKQAPAELPKLRWLEPVTHKNGTGHQVAEGTEYVIRKTFMADQLQPTYWAWRGRNLIGYKPAPEGARELCEARHRRETTCL